ncbi:MAG: MoxR family ATPase [Eubacteriales bacterium]|nr:MoxR family ATPase [Eubacteriales bacterium]
MHAENAARIATSIRENIAKVVVGRTETVDFMLVALLAGGHVLLEDVPGTGKTLLARSVARSMDMEFRRIQFTPDLLPSDVTGMSIYSQKSGEFEFKPGPVFANIVLADEINRATPRSQAALLECMEEQQVTADGVTYRLPTPFLVVATQNPVETQGTFPLPEAQLDRFLLKLRMGYPTTDEGEGILRRFLNDDPMARLSAVAGAQDMCVARQAVRDVVIVPALLTYMVRLVEATRAAPDVLLGASPRASLALMRAAQAYAILQGRDHLLPDDIKAVAQPVLAHRIICRNQFGGGGRAADHVVQQALSQVPVPTEELED